MINPFRKGILFGTVVSAIGAALGIVVVFVLVTAYTTASDTQKYFARHLNELLDTVESTASVATFVEDKQLAADMVAGLLKNDGVAQVVVMGTNKMLLASDGKSGTRAAGAIPATTSRAISRPIRSPFDKNKIIGEITLEPDFVEINRQVREKVTVTVAMLALQLAFVAAAVVLILLFAVVRPIRTLSFNLHHIDAAAGEKLKLPKGHEGDEIASLTDDINKLAGTLVASLSQEKQLRLQQAIDEQKYHSIFDNAGSGIFIADASGSIFSFNRSFARLTRFPIMANGGVPTLADLPWSDYERLAEMLNVCLRQRNEQTADFELITEKPCWVNVILSAVSDLQVQGVVTDVTPSKQAEADAKQMAITDKLTGLANRSGLERYLPEVIRQRPGEPLAMMVVNIKGFRQINESMGMSAGDELLRVIAKRLTGSVKKTDLIARIGGHEFALVLQGVCTQAAAEQVGMRITDVLRKIVEINETTIASDCSIGIAFYPEDGSDLSALLRNAEVALDHAKTAPQKHIQFFEPAMVVAAEQRRKLESELRQSIQQDALRLYYQPIVDLDKGSIVGAEALIRWQHPTRGLVPPDSFIPLAEESELICDIGLWVLETACRQLAEWQSAGRELYLSINVSARQIPDALPASLLKEAIVRHGIPSTSLALEITEGVLLADVDKGVNWIKTLRDEGFRIYMDDFGTGYSSLSYLKRFPIDVLKIDRSFIREMTEETNDRLLVQAIATMSHGLGLKVIAEGVENEGQISLLKQMGCHYGQGYYFSRPVPIGDFDRLQRVDLINIQGN